MYDDPVYVLLYGRVWVGRRKKKGKGKRNRGLKCWWALQALVFFFFFSHSPQVVASVVNLVVNVRLKWGSYYQEGTLGTELNWQPPSE